MIKKRKSSKTSTRRGLKDMELDFEDLNHLDLIHGKFYELSEEQQQELVSKQESYKNLYPDDPLHPCYYTVYPDTLPSEQAYRIYDSSK